MIKKLLFCFFFVSYSAICQEKDPVNKGAIQISAGTLYFYRVASIGYESPSLVQLRSKHTFKFSVNTGLWNARLSAPNTGTQINANLIYVFGEKAHKLEMDLGFTSHFDKGLKGQYFSYIATLPKFFLGYRYEQRKLYYKLGLGWYEALQVGIGYKF